MKIVIRFYWKAGIYREGGEWIDLNSSSIEEALAKFRAHKDAPLWEISSIGVYPHGD